jgi:hypothetical protein
VVLLSADCQAQVAFCNLIYFVMQGAALGERKKVSDIQVVGAIISPTTVSGINDAISDRLIRCRQAP